jgi:16S rRNA C1402 N4-methylase RsmH
MYVRVKYHTSTGHAYHQVIEALLPAPGKKYIDATIGGGGHTALLLGKRRSRTRL